MHKHNYCYQYADIIRPLLKRARSLDEQEIARNRKKPENAARIGQVVGIAKKRTARKRTNNSEGWGQNYSKLTPSWFYADHLGA